MDVTDIVEKLKDPASVIFNAVNAVKRLEAELAAAAAEIARLRAELAAQPMHWVQVDDAPAEWQDGRVLFYYAPEREGLPELFGHVAYHPDAGWCVDELREVSHLALPKAPAP
jgi:uncharacterized small protein (DUF1192 family)